MGKQTIQRSTAHERDDIRVSARPRNNPSGHPDVLVEVGEMVLELTDAEALALSECLGAVTQWNEEDG